MPVGVLLSNGKAIPGAAMELYRKSGQRNGTEPASQGATWTGTVTTCGGTAKRSTARAKLAKDTPRNSSSLRRQAAAGQGEAFTSNGTAKKVQLRQPKEQQWNSTAEKAPQWQG